MILAALTVALMSTVDTLITAEKRVVWIGGPIACEYTRESKQIEKPTGPALF